MACSANGWADDRGEPTSPPGIEEDGHLEFDEEGRLRSDDPRAEIARRFPQVTGGFEAVFKDGAFVTPTLKLRYRLFPEPEGLWKQLASPDFVSAGVGAEHLLSGIGWELIPEILSVNGGAAFVVTGEGRGRLYPAVGLDLLKF